MSGRPTGETPAAGGYRCGLAARGLPRTLATSVLTAAALGALRIDRAGIGAGSGLLWLLLCLGGILAFSFVRKGGELRNVFRVAPEFLAIGRGSVEARLRFADVETIDFEGPFSKSRDWLPAAVILDRQGRKWRIPALVERGGELIEELLQRSGRNDLRAWTDELRIASRMARSARWISVGYAVAAALPLGAWVLFLR